MSKLHEKHQASTCDCTLWGWYVFTAFVLLLYIIVISYFTDRLI